MSARGRGGGKTPKNVQKLLKEAVDKSSQAAVAKSSGLTRQTVQRYLEGIGEPTDATLRRLADYFDVSVAWLRGEKFKGPFTDADALLFIQMSEDLLEIYNIVPEKFKSTLRILMMEHMDEVSDFIYIKSADVGSENENKLIELQQKMAMLAMPECHTTKSNDP